MDNNVYITNNSLNQVLYRLDKNEFSYDPDKYQLDRFAKILTKPEQKYLAFYAEMIEHPENLLIIQERYIQNEKKDHFAFIHESKYWTYHSEKDCDRLISDFENYELPVEIKGKPEEVKIFRDFYKAHSNEYDLDTDIGWERFLVQIGAKLGKQFKNPPKKIEFSNSGVIDFENLSLGDTELSINELLAKMEAYRNSSEEIAKEINAKGFGSGRAKKTSDGKENHYKDIPEHPLYYWDKHKKQLKSLIRNYFRIKNNPDLNFDKEILDQLKFKPCSACSAPI